METIKDRINEIRDHYRLSNRGFAAARSEERRVGKEC